MEPKVHNSSSLDADMSQLVTVYGYAYLHRLYSFDSNFNIIASFVPRPPKLPFLLRFHYHTEDWDSTSSETLISTYTIALYNNNKRRMRGRTECTCPISSKDGRTDEWGKCLWQLMKTETGAAKAFFSYPRKPFIGTKELRREVTSKRPCLKSEHTVAYKITSECDTTWRAHQPLSPWLALNGMLRHSWRDGLHVIYFHRNVVLRFPNLCKLSCEELRTTVYNLWYGCETWSLRLKELHSLTVLETQELGRTFETRREEEQGTKTISWALSTHHRMYYLNEMGGTCRTHGRGNRLCANLRCKSYKRHAWG